MNELTPRMRAAHEAVVAAAMVCRGVQTGLGGPERIGKADGSPVTIADFAAQAVANIVLAKHLGAIRMVGEESSAYLRKPDNGAVRDACLAAARVAMPSLTEAELLDAIDLGSGAGDGSSTYWTIDPIDGTKGFIHGRHYSVCLALVERGVAVASAIACPTLGLDVRGAVDLIDHAGSVYLAERGRGLASGRCESGAGVAAFVREGPASALLSESYHGEHSDKGITAQILRTLALTTPGLRIDSQCKYVLAARGSTSGYFRIQRRHDAEYHVWDHVAGLLLCEEAGLKTSDLRGRPLDCSSPPDLRGNVGVVAAEPAMWERIVSAGKDCLAG
jgi:3'(2'), 5'-bisphosphate nucleotidase